MKIIWDEPKRLANLDSHGMDFFAELTEAFFDNAVFLEANKPRRIKGIGVNSASVICVVFVRYGQEAFSIISMRPASKKEREFFHDEIKKG